MLRHVAKPRHAPLDRFDRALVVRAPEVLREILDAAPNHDAITLCANSYGRPWTESEFRSSWEHFRKALEKAGHIGRGLTLYGLRHGDPQGVRLR